MRILGLVVALVFINCRAAQTKRSSAWLLANTQIFTTKSSTPQNCYIPATGETQSESITLLRTTNMAITGTFVQLSQGKCK